MAIVCTLVASIIGVQTLRLALANHEITTLKAQDAAQQAAYVAETAKAATISSQASASFQTATAAIPLTFAPIKARIATNVPPKADALCAIDPDFIGLWDAASQ